MVKRRRCVLRLRKPSLFGQSGYTFNHLRDVYGIVVDGLADICTSFFTRAHADASVIRQRMDGYSDTAG